MKTGPADLSFWSVARRGTYSAGRRATAGPARTGITAGRLRDRRGRDFAGESGGDRRYAGRRRDFAVTSDVGRRYVGRRRNSAVGSDVLVLGVILLMNPLVSYVHHPRMCCMFEQWTF